MDSANQDSAREIAARVAEAYAKKSPLAITGGGSKSFLVNGAVDQAAELSVANHAGVLSYEPTELVISARAATRISELRETLAAKGQHLPFDPPVYATTDTLGGVIACGVSGPSRPYSGAARDFVLGTQLVNGKGEILKFGGEVMKNVAGYDVSRLQVGACGTLGVLLDVSLKVLPQMQSRETRYFEMPSNKAIAFLEQLARKPLPLAASAVMPAGAGGKVKVLVRFAGSIAAVQRAVQDEGGEALEKEQEHWSSMRDLTHRFFTGPANGAGIGLWRITVPAALPLHDFLAAVPGVEPTDCLVDWGGGLRWVRSSAGSGEIYAAVSRLAGQVTGCGTIGGQGFGQRQPLSHSSATMARLQQRIKHSFDPAGILNPGVFGYGV